MPELFTTPAAAPDFRHATCPGCSTPVVISSPGGGWLLDGLLWHAACAPWRDRPFPFRWALVEGDRLLGRLRRASGPVSGNLVRAVAYLDQSEAAWCPNDPVPVLARSGLAATVVEHWKVKLKPAPVPGR